MSYKLKQKITKKPDENWVLNLNSNLNLSQTSDSRDNNNLFNKAEENIFKIYRQKIKQNTGFIGFDRNYIDNNNLEITHYFNNETGARLYFSNIRNNNIKEVEAISKLLQFKIENKTMPQYIVSWKLFNNNDEEINL